MNEGVGIQASVGAGVGLGGWKEEHLDNSVGEKTPPGGTYQR